MTKAAARPSRAKPRRQGLSLFGKILNALSLVLVLLTCLVGAVIALLFNNPGVVALVPGGSAFLPPTLPAVAFVLSTETAQQAGPTAGPAIGFPTLPPEWTATATPTITKTPLPPTETPVPSETSRLPSATPTATGTATGTPTTIGSPPPPTATRSTFNFTLHNDGPIYVANFLNTASCDWFGFAGQAFDLAGRPVINFTVHLSGGGLEVEAVTGSQPAIGPGGYQIPIANHPTETTDVYRVQLRNNTGTPLSDWYTIRTYGDCERNLVLINFVQNH